MLSEARRIERPEEDARLQAEPSHTNLVQNAKPADILYDFLASKELKDALNEEVPYQKSQDKRESTKNFEKTEHWEKIEKRSWKMVLRI
jgi:hypothetical protein